MNNQGLGWKTGLFVLIGLILLGALMLQFQKGTKLFTSTYEIELKTSNVGLIKQGATVLMAGVPIGHVRKIKLEQGGKSVTLLLEIQKRYKIYSDARFVIEQIGLLGDQFVSVLPQKNQGDLLQDGDTVVGEEPFSFQAMARSTKGLIDRVNQTVRQIQETFSRVDEHLLGERTLTNLSTTVGNFRNVSTKVGMAMNTFNGLLVSNAPAINLTVSNALHFSEDLEHIGEELQEIVATNRNDLNRVVQNLEDFSATTRDLAKEVKSGEGVAGLLLNDSKSKQQLGSLIENLTNLSSNLNKYGIFYKPKPKRPKKPVYPGKNPFPP